MSRRTAVRAGRTLELAHAFLEEARRDMERAAQAACDLPPRLRSVHDRVGHATPEYRTLAIPSPEQGAAPTPEMLSQVIASYAARKRPTCLLLALDGTFEAEDGSPTSVLIAEARDAAGTRMYWMQPFRVVDGSVLWDEPVEGGWQDPRAEEMILDAAFASEMDQPPVRG